MTFKGYKLFILTVFVVGILIVQTSGDLPQEPWQDYQITSAEKIVIFQATNDKIHKIELVFDTPKAVDPDEELLVGYMNIEYVDSNGQTQTIYLDSPGLSIDQSYSIPFIIYTSKITINPFTTEVTGKYKIFDHGFFSPDEITLERIGKFNFLRIYVITPLVVGTIYVLYLFKSSRRM